MGLFSSLHHNFSISSRESSTQGSSLRRQAQYLTLERPPEPFPERPPYLARELEARKANKEKHDHLWRTLGEEWTFTQDQESDDVIVQFRLNNTNTRTGNMTVEDCKHKNDQNKRNEDRP